MFLQPWLERVEATEPIMRMAGEPEPPEPPSADEWRVMLVRLQTFGSPAVADVFDKVTDAVRDFFIQASRLRAIRDRPQLGEEEPWREVQEARERVREVSSRLHRLVSDELAAL